MGLGSIVLNVFHPAALTAPCVVNQQLGVLAEGLVQELLRRLRDTAHRPYAILGQSGHGSVRDLPEIREGLMIPQSLPEQFFVKVAQNDSMKDEEFYHFLLDSFKNMADHLEKGGAAYVFHADTEGLNFRRAFIDAGFHLAGCCIWVKDSLVLGRSDYQWQHEPVLYGFMQNGKHPWYSDRKQTTIWNFAKPKRNANHPTSKPLDLLGYHTFTHFIKCGRCGANYRCQTHKRVDGTVVRSWYCSSPTAVGCSKVGIREDTLKALIADVIGLPEFDEELFNQQLAYATVPADNQIVFHFRDGHEASRTFVQKRQMPRQTEERKKHMSEVMKAKWRERHAEND